MTMNTEIYNPFKRKWHNLLKSKNIELTVYHFSTRTTLNLHNVSLGDDVCPSGTRSGLDDRRRNPPIRKPYGRNSYS
ncbi:hypothetical protein U14_06017 [Candidatus Moduliflexus flocculans]|uniref:Uncharacterized protein n=1 Tax=Candidatus Moduliflexus flocculans TaxID=1499966 RepID=A0A081BTJ8_9BACT|nr:hypothetical protein U14_06017 [Candidatus Moduliflexus flocculans]